MDLVWVPVCSMVSFWSLIIILLFFFFLAAFLRELSVFSPEAFYTFEMLKPIAELSKIFIVGYDFFEVCYLNTRGGFLCSRFNNLWPYGFRDKLFLNFGSIFEKSSCKKLFLNFLLFGLEAFDLLVESPKLTGRTSSYGEAKSTASYSSPSPDF